MPTGAPCTVIGYHYFSAPSVKTLWLYRSRDQAFFFVVVVVDDESHSSGRLMSFYKIVLRVNKQVIMHPF